MSNVHELPGLKKTKARFLDFSLARRNPDFAAAKSLNMIIYIGLLLFFEQRRTTNVHN